MQIKDRKQMKELYFDESGYTGDNLLNSKQRTFSYGSVCIDEIKETPIIKSIIKNNGIQGNELKGARLLKSNRGRKFLKFLVDQYSDSVKICIHDKRYALAAHIFEFLIEPVIADFNSYFYESNFHLYITNILYLYLQTNNMEVEQMFCEFEAGIRKRNLIERLNELGLAKKTDDPCRMIFEFGLLNREKIEGELGDATKSRERWMLDLSLTSLYSLLTEWGQVHSPIYAICDESKPLAANSNIIDDIMLHRTDSASYKIMGEDIPLTCNLAQPIKFGLSKDSIGLQIADCFAAIGSFCYEYEYDDFTKYCLPKIEKAISRRSIWPQINKFDDLDTKCHLCILIELLQMAREGRCIDKKFISQLEIIRQNIGNIA